MRETPKAAAAFLKFCELGIKDKRSLSRMTEVYPQYAKSLPLLKRWSAAHNWQERVKAYDREVSEEKRRKRDAEIEQMNERHALIGTTQQERALAQIERLIEARRFGSQASVQLLKLATDVERLARGAPTEHIEQTNTGEAASEWTAVYAVVVRVLRNFPDAALAVAEALEELEGRP